MIFPALGRLALAIGVVGVLAIVISGCSYVGKTSFSQQPAAVLEEKTTWPHTESDLIPDPGVRFGHLSNGFRYVMMENKTPAHRVSMHLYVQVGSLAEFKGEEGIAHFLEHMLFDGSTHFPPGEMVKYFQRIGMQFGPDANAHTGFGQTVYDILLPKADPKSIEDGLLVLGDFAEGALLLPSEVDKEKKVVLAEKRARDSARYRTIQKIFGFEMPDSLLADRFPIGETESILAFDANKLRHFYDTWYRPDRMILVMVGDFDAAAALPLVKSQFETMRARKEKSELPPFGFFKHEGIKSFHHYEKEMGAATVSIEAVEQKEMTPDSVDRRHRILREEIAQRMMQWRLDRLVHETDGMLTNARVSAGDYLQQIRFSELSADCKPDHWEKVLVHLERALRQAVEFGFTPSELKRAKKSLQAELKQDVASMNSRESRELAEQIMDSVNQWEVFQNPSQRLNLLGPMIDAVELEDINHAFDDLWPDDHRLVLVTGNVEIAGPGKSPEEKILSAYQSSSIQPVDQPADAAVAVFPYLEPPEAAGKIRQKEVVSDLDIVKVHFDNGVNLILKKTDFKENEVQAAISFGRGKYSEPADQPGLAQMTEAVINGSGLGSMNRIELENALAGRLAEMALDVREDMFVLNGQSSSSELKLLFELFYSMLKDPGYRTEALTLARKQFEQKNRSMRHQVEGLMQLQGHKLLGGGDERLGWPELKQLRQITIEQIKTWFGSQIDNAPLEITIVGDFQIDEAISLASLYFGSLPARNEPVRAVQRPDPEFAIGGEFVIEADTAIERGLAVVAFPTDDFWDIGKTRRLSILSEIFSERLRVHVREKLGASYSPYTYNRAYRAYPGYGVLQAMLLVDPDRAKAIITEVETIAEELKTGGVNQDELRRALDPTLVQIKDLRQTNSYWLNSVMIGASRYPVQFSWAKSIEKDYAAIDAAEISALAKRYLVNRKAASVVIVPKTLH